VKVIKHIKQIEWNREIQIRQPRQFNVLEWTNNEIGGLIWTVTEENRQTNVGYQQWTPNRLQNRWP